MSTDDSDALPPEAQERLERLMEAERGAAADAAAARSERVMAFFRGTSTILAGAHAILLFLLLPPEWRSAGAWLTIPVTLSMAMVWTPRKAKAHAVEAHQPPDRTPDWLVSAAAWVILLIIVVSLAGVVLDS